MFLSERESCSGRGHRGSRRRESTVGLVLRPHLVESLRLTLESIRKPLPTFSPPKPSLRGTLRLAVMCVCSTRPLRLGDSREFHSDQRDPTHSGHSRQSTRRPDIRPLFLLPPVSRLATRLTPPFSPLASKHSRLAPLGLQTLPAHDAGTSCQRAVHRRRGECTQQRGIRKPRLFQR